MSGPEIEMPPLWRLIRTPGYLAPEPEPEAPPAPAPAARVRREPPAPAAYECDYRVPAPGDHGCGCYRPALCLLGRAWRVTGLVSLADCTECVNGPR